jgi:hypothetical protein
MDAWLKFALEAPWSASLVVLVAAVLGAVIGGWFSIRASRLAMRDSLKAQLDLQHQEWERRDAERNQERAGEQRERDERTQSDTTAIRAVAIEALFNCVNLLGFIKLGRNVPDPRLLVSRECYDRALESLMRAAEPGNVQLLTNVHASARVFQFSIIDRTAGLALDETARKKAQELSQSFEIMFRMFGQKYFSPPNMQTLETTLNVAKVELG